LPERDRGGKRAPVAEFESGFLIDECGGGCPSTSMRCWLSRSRSTTLSILFEIESFDQLIEAVETLDRRRVDSGRARSTPVRTGAAGWRGGGLATRASPSASPSDGPPT
jgi:hypothetical protein